MVRELSHEEIVEYVKRIFGGYPVTDVGMEAIRVLMQSRYEGMIVVDDRCRTIFLSRANEKFFGVSTEEALFRPFPEISPSTRLNVVVETGRPEIGDVHIYDGGEMRIVARIPIIGEGKSVKGAIGKIIFYNCEKLNELARTVAVLKARLKKREKETQGKREIPYTFNDILYVNDRMGEIVSLARKIASTDSSVLITGETGTGKELFAQAIHGESRRRNGPFVSVNCSSIPEELAESELFGFREGAFSGARKGGKKGKFHLAEGGTIFLDEIHELPLRLQSKLLRAIQEKEIDPVGSDEKPEKVDFRLIAASNQNLEDLVEKKRFRADLFFRLNQTRIHIPPLRERKDDIEFYLNHFLEEVSLKVGITRKRFTRRALSFLLEYSWPGNIRELKNVVEQALWSSRGTSIDVGDLPEYMKKVRFPEEGNGRLTLREYLDRAERSAIIDALKRAGGSRTRAAELLGLHRSALFKKMRKHGIEEREIWG
ncbi:MAG: AAA family ATPase [Deltaproteobacteria bacterium]|nr:MAG: AAA family ATPase [Deltaproteobacteria bacterium]